MEKDSPWYRTDISSKQNDATKVGRKLYKVEKRALDIVVSSIGLVILSPVFLGIVITMKICEPKGSIFFNHSRYGLGGEKFKMYKFRSMCVGAEDMLMNDKELFEEYKINGYKFPDGKDPRITKIGKFLRKTSLDELPQLMNVLIGNMSLVGPRPIIEKELNEYKDKKSEFLSVKPGITGLWQTSGRSAVGYPERCNLELQYVKNACFSLDLKIILNTFIAVLKKEGAY